MEIFLFFSAFIILVCVTWGLSKANKPFITSLKSAVSGLSALLLVNLLSGRTGCYIAINAATVFVSTVLSLPGVLCLLVMKLIFNY